MGNPYGKLLVLCALYHGTAAFTVGVQKKQHSAILHARHPLYAGDNGYSGISSIGIHRVGSRPPPMAPPTGPPEDMEERTTPRVAQREVQRVGRIREMNARMMEREDRAMQDDLFVIGRNMGGQITRMNQLQSEQIRRLPHDVTNARLIQGESREIWSAQGNHRYGQMEVYIDSEGRPINAEFELYQGPNNVRQRIKFYSENGLRFPFCALVDTPTGVSHSVSVRNTGSTAYPFTSSVQGRRSEDDGIMRDMTMAPTKTVQGGSLKTFPFFDAEVETVQVSLKSEGMPIMAVVELWKGPNNIKQVAEIYTDDGSTKPVNLLVDTGGYESTIAVYNTGPLTFPLEASVEPV